MREKPTQTRAAMEGRVTAKTCACCGHHDVGIMLENGQFVALRPGMIIKILESHPASKAPGLQGEK